MLLVVPGDPFHALEFEGGKHIVRLVEVEQRLDEFKIIYHIRIRLNVIRFLIEIEQ